MWYADGVVVAVVPRMCLPLSSTSVTGWPNCMCTCVGMLVAVVVVAIATDHPICLVGDDPFTQAWRRCRTTAGTSWQRPHACRPWRCACRKMWRGASWRRRRRSCPCNIFTMWFKPHCTRHVMFASPIVLKLKRFKQAGSNAGLGLGLEAAAVLGVALVAFVARHQRALIG